MLGLFAYVDYYETVCPDLVDFQLISASDTTHLSAMDWSHWPQKLSTQVVPCLESWITRRLEILLPNNAATMIPYIHVPGVNDFANSLVGMIVSALFTEKLPGLAEMFTDRKRLVLFLLEFWSKNVILWNDNRLETNNIYKVKVDLNCRFGSFITFLFDFFAFVVICFLDLANLYT